MGKALKKHFFLITFIATNIFFIFLLIHKQTMSSRLFYQQQELEQTINNLNARKQEFTEALYLKQDKAHIKEIAVNKLGMQKISLRQIKKLSHDNKQQ